MFVKEKGCFMKFTFEYFTLTLNNYVDLVIRRLNKSEISKHKVGQDWICPIK